MTGPYSVILETSKLAAPELIWTTPSEAKARDLVHTILKSFPAGAGVKAYIRTADTADQLQVSQRGWVVRDQPHLPAVGEDVEVHVPTVHLAMNALAPR